jgi:hypothetical protein
MADEVQAPEEETPVSEAPATETPPEERVDYEKRYNDLRPQYDRSNQELSEYRKLVEGIGSDDPDVQKASLEAIGLSYQEPEETDDEYQALQKRLDKLEQGFTTEQEQRQLEAQRQAEIDHLDSQISALEKAEGIELTEAEVKILAATASHHRAEDGMPDVASAYKLLSEVDQPRQERRVKSKKAAQVQTGTAAAKTFDRSNEAERVAYMAQKLESFES